MEKEKHFIKVFTTDEDGNYVVNFGGSFTEVVTSSAMLASCMGNDIMDEMDTMLKNDDDAVYGFRIDYTLTPIRTNPFE